MKISFQNPESAIDHDASSNLLPMLSIKSLALTHILTQVLLNQYKNNTQLGETSAEKDIDMKRLVFGAISVIYVSCTNSA